MKNDILYTAPYIQIIEREGTRYFARMDQGARSSLVAVTPVTERVLMEFSAGSSKLFVTSSDARDKKIAKSLVEQLEAAEFLLPGYAAELIIPSLELEVTNLCNANCIMCPRGELRSLGSMSEGTFERLLQLLQNVKLNGVIIQGIGEPTLHPNLPLWIAKLRQVLGADPPIVVVTNGFRMTPKVFDKLLQAGLSHLQWSFHSLIEQNYNRIFGSRTFPIAKKNFENCAAAHADRISVNFVLMEENKNEIEQMKAWLKQLGLGSSMLRPIPCFTRGDSISSRQFGVSGAGQAEPRGRCLYIRKSLFLAWDGRLLPCSNDIRGEAGYFDITVGDLSEVLETWRRKILAPPPSFRMCKGCDHYTRNTIDTAWFDQLMHAQALQDR